MLYAPDSSCRKPSEIEESLFFVQYSCKMHITDQERINLDALAVVSLGIFGALFYLISIKINLRQSLKITKKQYRDRVTTIEDYTVAIRLTQKQIHYFESHIYNNYNEKSYAL